MSDKKLKRPRDAIQLAKLIGDIATGNVTDVAPDDGKNQDAVALGRRGGAARAALLSKKRKVDIARDAAKKRWRK